ncbi:GNAT family N-acetyltransferase [Paenibacillus shenyangensis]|uniref:GNAT family N-acetyltransferase n=1 Tax=Paenibacillus sp. A9 TaxID=1284352 RepID=UPI0003791E52|nr:GNAT family N-acetyltransferase [Paenibacillus sp. A9]
MRIDIAVDTDYNFIVTRDHHIAKELVEAKIHGSEIYILREADQEIGWMRFNYFWDNTPFMNMIWIDEEYRGRGYGAQVVKYWEDLMREQGFTVVMTSTQSNEEAQHFYRKLGYQDAGCLLQDNEPLELIMSKKL